MFDLLVINYAPYLFSDILQPWVQPDHSRRSLSSSCSFASEPEPSGVKVSSAIHVLTLLNSLYTKFHTWNVNMSEPHTCNVNVSETHTRNANVSEPHTRNVNVSEPHSGNDLCECE